MRAWMRFGRSAGCLLLAGGVLLSVALLSAGGCGEMLFFANQTASLGGDVAGQRGNIRVLFINNTPNRAVCTFGTYDQTDQNSIPDFAQFGPNEFDVNLDGNAESEILFLDCARTFSIGSNRLLELIAENADEAAVIDEAVVEGVSFFEVPAEEDSEASEPELIPAGTAPSFEALLGVDFPCNSLLIIRFEYDDLGPAAFRIDFEMIPSESTR